MKKFRNALGGTIGFITALISITPELSTNVGNFMNEVYKYIPQWAWAFISLFIFLGLLVWHKVEGIQEGKNVKTSTKIVHNEQNNSDNSIGIQNSTFNAPVTFRQMDDKKKDDQLLVQEKIEKTMNDAIAKSIDFANDYFPDGKPSREERYVLAHEANKVFWEYYKDNRRYVSSSTSIELDTLKDYLHKEITSINRLYIAENHLEIARHNEDLKAKTLSMREKILNSFREGPNHAQKKQSEPLVITPVVIKNERWVSMVVPNPTNHAIECYCVLKYVELNGNINKKTKRYIAAHTSRVSWSGGDTTGKEEGVKLIDEESVLNIASPTAKGLSFEMAKGTRCLGDNFDYGVGTYKLGIEINYRHVGIEEYQSNLIDVRFNCYKKEAKIINEKILPNIIRHRISLLSFIGQNSADFLYVQIFFN